MKTVEALGAYLSDNEDIHYLISIKIAYRWLFSQN